jgi:hypothetical protein
MKKNILTWLITAITFTFSTTAFADEAVMQSAKSKIIIKIGITSEIKNLVIDWGDGHTSGISDGVQLSDITGVKDFTHNYTDGKMHTITLTCSNISYLSCISNELISLSISNCPDLEYLFCYENQLTSLNIKDCPNLVKLSCGQNQLTSLDVSECTNLGGLYCGANQLMSLDVSECTHLEELYCHENQLTSLGISNCTSLIQLYCYENKLTNLHINSKWINVVSCGENRLRSLTLIPCILHKLYCKNNLLTNLDINNTRIDELDCSYNPLTSLDASNTYLKKLNINGCKQLKELICNVDNVKISSEGCYGLSIIAPIPEGTITVNMRNSSDGGDVTIITPEGFSDGFYIKGDNFYGKDYKFKVVGKKAGIAGIGYVPTSAWAEKVAVMPGYAYIARKVESVRDFGNSYTVSVKFVQIYVIREITSAESGNKGGVIGAEVQYRVVGYDYD